MRNAGLFIGRFQPPHEGHKKCVEYILKRHDFCVVAIRDTRHDKNNPYTLAEREDMLLNIFPEEIKGRMIVTVIPDIDTVYMGRRVGYHLIKLDEETEKISATDIRKKLYGQT